MKNPADTLFVRLALMTVGLIVAVHVLGIVLLDRERFALEVEQTRRAVALSVQARATGGELGRAVSSTLGASFVNVGDAAAYGCPASCADTNGPFERDLRRQLPPGSHVVADEGTNALWVRYPDDHYWVTMTSAMPSFARFIGMSSLTVLLAIALAVLGAWHLQRPLRRLAQAAREYRLGHRPPVVRESGPREVKELVGDFNDMVRELALMEQERSVMLAGLAHDLRAPITRMQVRADLLPDEANRTGFLRDAQSLSRIVTQFLDFARDAADASPVANVDAHCRQHYGDSLGEDALLTLDLRAGDGFGLPLVDLDRILSNLIENALTYGEPPVEIATRATAGGYVLSVRDHGAGIPPAQLERALRPFVRLDAARGGDAHCGLGLAIVRRLVRYHGGALAACNAPDGGFVATMTFPLPSRGAITHPDDLGR
ncbi:MULTISPECIES: ATP-binding protein [unclassified Burkholderia]|uniref:ATP-binding protein n=1 Tax=unclassified Burkholderia TaxID=2613784 RepID=UPI000757E202|nr:MULTISPECIES: ATP-binding protein [unclassified Burkholderia]AOK49271.1 histidine kinase [Burkholderia sp. MSMB617WGS]KVK71845.1 histidine kinase [Burkholderia sp. MSMB1498]